MSFRVENEQTPTPWQSPEASGAASSAPPTDIAAAILECIVRSRGSQQDTARLDTQRAHELLERARREMHDAMERAKDAEANGDFWGDLGSILGGDVAAIAGVVAAVALAVATGGAGTAAVLALVAAGLTTGAKVGQELGADPRLTAVMGACGGVLGLFAGNAAGAGNVWTTVAQVSSSVQGAASGAGGGASVAEGHYRGEAIDERANAKEAQNRQNDAWLRLDLAIDVLERACRDVSRAKEGASSIQRTQDDGAQTLIARIGAA